MSIRDFEDILSYKRYGATVDFSTPGIAKVANNADLVVIGATSINLQSGKCPQAYDNAKSSSHLGAVTINCPWNYTMVIQIKEKARKIKYPYLGAYCEDFFWIETATPEVALSPNESITLRPRTAKSVDYGGGNSPTMYGMEITLLSATPTGGGSGQDDITDHRYIVFSQKPGQFQQSSEYGTDLAGATSAYNTLLANKGTSCYSFLALEDWAVSPHVRLQSWSGTPPAGCSAVGPSVYTAYWWNKTNTSLVKVGGYDTLDKAKVAALDMLAMKAYGQAYVTDTANKWLWFNDYKATNQTKVCLNGAVVAIEAECPAETKTCSNGAIVPVDKPCPSYTKTCKNGSVVAVDAACPNDKVSAGYKQCSDGSIVPEAAVCPGGFFSNLGGATPMLLIGGVGVVAAGVIAVILLGGKKEGGQ